MIDYILGVRDPIEWHSQVGVLRLCPFLGRLSGKWSLSEILKSLPSFGMKNLKKNNNHYASWMVNLGGAKLVLPLTLSISHILHFLNRTKIVKCCLIRSLELQIKLVQGFTSTLLFLGITRYLSIDIVTRFSLFWSLFETSEQEKLCFRIAQFSHWLVHFFLLFF